ncbi:hypothetical protein [Halobacterium jilantaiense]|uniref:CARDB protein n=1 Tax=Halobacterium jilantaiense TaxID=355548 RepID=A0A1I0MPB0_9EURY|nr:hypothetical protein [Halobacterium jilantaiense]SEV90076.1 hypothetical protein SAMN04487945_0238 [Halobacterium jilantaiense]
MDRAAVAVVALLVASLAAPVAGQPAPAADDHSTAVEADTELVRQSATDALSAADADSDGQTATIQKRVELFLTPEEPGRIDVVVAYTLPDAVSSLSVRVPDRTVGVETSDFEQTSDDYEWDGEDDAAQLRVTVDANRSASGSRSGALAQEGEYSFLDAGDWAVVTVPTFRTGWGWSGPEGLTVDISETTSVAGEGSTGGELALLGDVTEYTRTASGQTFTLAVPARADMAEGVDDVLDALAAASQRMQVGDRDDRVWIGVAPTDAEWGVRGVEYGGNDAWVLADARLDEPSNVWLHEYVHTRQGYTTAESGRWTMEAAAEYYAAALSLDLDYVDFSQYREYLGYGGRDPWREAVLASPSTWSSGANYLKGSLVWGDLDRRVRLATDHRAAMRDVLWALNRQDGDVSNGDVVDAVRNASTPAVASAAERFTTTDATPEMWSRGEYSAAFSVEPPRLTVADTEYSVAGPFRNETFQTVPTLYVGETLTVTATVTNAGGTRGEYEARLDDGNRTVAVDSGSLAGDESTELAVEHMLASAGTYNLTLGRDTRPVTVRSPATVRVQDLSVDPDRVPVGGRVNVTATLANPTADPARGPVAVTLDDERVAALNVTLAAGASTTRTTTLTLSAAGRYEVGAGDQMVTVRSGESSGTAPGFGLTVAALAASAAALVAARAR